MGYETVFNLPPDMTDKFKFGSAEPSVGLIFESTADGMMRWWHKRPVVRWLDDRNEANRLGVSVEELLAARAVADAFEDAKLGSGMIQVGFDLSVPSPRHHRQIKRITS